MSEIAILLQIIDSMKQKNQLKVLSIGCGPCTDLFALDLLKQKEEYTFQHLEYRGIDLSESLWGDIHKKIVTLSPHQVNYYYTDIIEVIDDVIASRWHPDIVIFQYVLSDMQKNMVAEELRTLRAALQHYFNNVLETGAFFLFNDINLNVNNQGGRDHFDWILNGLKQSKSKKLHFLNNNKQSCFPYGERWQVNSLVSEIPTWLQEYSPFTSCSSAQLIVKKVIP